VRLIDYFFNGNYPNSPAAISFDVGWLPLLLQTVLFFLPGMLVAVNEANKWHEMPDEQMAKHLAKGRLLSLEGNSEPLSTPSLLRKGKSWISATSSKSLPTSEEEEPEDWAISVQAAHVKFLVHQIFYLGYIVLAAVFLIREDVNHPPTYDFAYGLPQDYDSLEIFFWVWSGALLIGELEQIVLKMPPDVISSERFELGTLLGRLGEGSRLHFRVGWNSLSLATYCLALLAFVLRCWPSDEYQAQVAARCIYAVVLVLLGVRLLETVRISQQVRRPGS
jgi:hypothetical protein